MAHSVTGIRWDLQIRSPRPTIGLMHIKMNRKIVAALFITLLFASVFTACASELNNNKKEETASIAALNKDELSDSGSISVAKVGNDTDIPSFMTSAKTEHGLYTLVEWPIGAYSENSPWIHCGNIIYVDYQTGQKIYLCNNPGCSHNTEECQSYIRYPGSCTLFTNVSGEKLYCMAYGAENGEIYSENDCGRIYEMNLDGTDRRELTVLPSNMCFSMQDAVFSSKEKLYVGVLKTNSSSKTTDHVLMSIDIRTGAMNEICRLSLSAVLLQMEGENAIVLQSLDSNGVHVIRRILQTAEEDILFESTEISPFVNGDRIITCKLAGTEAIITVQNYIKQETKTITIEGIYTQSPIIMFCCVDDTIHLSYYTETGDVKELYVDLANGKVWDKKLTYTSYGETRFVQIVSSLDDRYLVIGDYKEIEVSFVDGSGVQKKYSVVSPQLALIDKEDYWQNIPEYEWIEDKTIYS